MSSIEPTTHARDANGVAAAPSASFLKRALVQLYPLDLQKGPIRLTANRLTIGRDSNCNLVISDPSVSRQHAELRLTDQGAVLLDLNSTNGVSVNGNRGDTHVLADGDHLQVGTHLFRYLSTTDDLDSRYQATIYTILTRDSLTGVFNRRYLDETLRRDVARCRRHSRPISLVMIDVDGFVEINERLGMLLGDQVLRHVTKRLENILRAEDLLARTGGNRFALVLADSPLEEAVEISERCRQSVACEPMATSIGPVRVTIRLGIASRVPDKAEGKGAHSTRTSASATELIAEATERLEEAKRAGGNRTVC
jgi:diguanylate cyclase (GGDEF)-like protein